jgi:hypothetical protein
MIKTWLRRFVVCAVLSLVVSGATLGQNCKIDGFNAARSGVYAFADGVEYIGLRGKLTNPNFFDPSIGAAPFSIALQPGQTTVTGSSLTYPNTTVFVTGWTSSYTSAERSAILAFVMSGGNFLGQFDDTYDSIADLFGITQPDVQGPPNQMILDRDHVIMDGPFGGVESLIGAGNIGQFSLLPGSTGRILAANQVGSAAYGAAIVVFEKNALGPGSGRVVINNDANYGSTGEGGGDDTVMMLNTFAYLCGAPRTRGGNTYYFPQTARDGGFTTTVFTSSAFTSTSVSNVGVTFFTNSGAQTGSCGPSPQPGSTTFGCGIGNVQSGPQTTGWARTRSNDPNSYFAQENFLLSDVAGNPVTAVGVPPASPGHTFTLAGSIGPHQDMGLAILALPTNGGTATITVTAFGPFGAQIGSPGILTLNPGQQTAAFISQGPFNVPQTSYSTVSLTISSDQQIAVLALGDAEPGFKIFGTPVFMGRR